MHNRSFAAFAHGRRGGMLAMAAAMFVLGLAAGATVRPSLSPQVAASAAPALLAPPAPPVERDGEPMTSAGANPQRLEPRLVYPADVVRVIDGDTFAARVQVWPGLAVDTKVRLRGIDAPELHARCDDERVRAEAARVALTTILAEGGVAIARVGIDKYGGRVDASVATRNTADVSAALLNGGFARAYDGGRRGTWC